MRQDMMKGGRKLEEFTFPAVAEYLRKYISASPTFSKNEKSWLVDVADLEVQKKIKEGLPIMGFNGKNISKRVIKPDTSNEHIKNSSVELVDSDDVDSL